MRNIMKNVLILGAGGQIARHVINQLADKQTIKQTLFARQPAKIHKPYPTNSKIIMGDVLNHAALKQAMQGQDVVYANLTGEDLDIQANSVIAAGNDSNLLIVFYVQIMPDDFVMQLHRF